MSGTSVGNDHEPGAPSPPGADEVPTEPPHPLRPLVGFQGCLSLVLLVFLLAGAVGFLARWLRQTSGAELDGLEPTLATIFTAAACLAAAASSLITAGLPVRPHLSLTPSRAPAIAAGALFGAGVVLVNLWISLPLFETYDPVYAETLEREVRSMYGLVTPVGVLLLIGVVVPFCEEVFFRGFLLNAFRGRWSTTASVVASSVLFALFHVHPIHAAVIFLPGVLMAVTAVVSRSLWPAVALHVVNNSLALLIDLTVDDGFVYPIWLVAVGIGLIVSAWRLLESSAPAAIGERTPVP